MAALHCIPKTIEEPSNKPWQNHNEQWVSYEYQTKREFKASRFFNLSTKSLSTSLNDDDDSSSSGRRCTSRDCPGLSSTEAEYHWPFARDTVGPCCIPGIAERVAWSTRVVADVTSNKYFVSPSPTKRPESMEDSHWSKKLRNVLLNGDNLPLSTEVGYTVCESLGLSS